MKKIALVTGGSRGIGKAIVKTFSENGYIVIINYLKNDKLAEELAESCEEAHTFRADVSNRIEVDKMVNTIIEKYGRIDILVNNAGIAEQKLFTDITQNDWDKMFSINVDGMFNCTQAVVKNMISEKKGKIINISSIWGMVGASCEVHYSTTKAAIIGFTKALAKELAPSNIYVNCVAPGVISTEMNNNLTKEDIDALKEETPLGVIGKPCDVAQAVLFLASENSDFITGQVLSPNGGFVV